MGMRILAWAGLLATGCANDNEDSENLVDSNNTNDTKPEHSEDDCVDVYVDGDNDSYAGSEVLSYCGTDPLPSNYFTNRPDIFDCNDDDPATSPMADEVCDGIDNNCDGLVDDEDQTGLVGGTKYYFDYDEDGYGDPLEYELACTIPAGYVENAEDCDDSTDLANPGMNEICGDFIDNDCSGDAPECVYEGDYNLGEDADNIFDGLTGEYVGNALSGMGDIDGDGYDDMLIGAMSNGYGEGDAFILLGDEDGIDDVYYQIEGENEYDYFGKKVVGGKDITGDGELDFVVSALGYDTEYANVGRAYVFDGLPNSTTTAASEAYATVTGSIDNQYLGSHLALASDMDGDGIAELAMGNIAYGWDGANAPGAVTLIYGGSNISGETEIDVMIEGATQYDGLSTTIGEDLDGDGLADLAVGAHNNRANGYRDDYDPTVIATYGSGMVGIFKSSETRMSGTYTNLDADIRIYGGAAGDRFGFSLTSGDVDGDGTKDLIVGANTHNTSEAAREAGAVYIFTSLPEGGEVDLSGSSSADITIESEVDSHWFGVSVAAGNFIYNSSDDTSDEVLVGANCAGYDRSSCQNEADDDPIQMGAFLFSNLDEGTYTDSNYTRFYEGESISFSTGAAVANTGDNNGDDIEDFTVGDPFTNINGNYSGSAYLFFGSGY